MNKMKEMTAYQQSSEEEAFDRGNAYYEKGETDKAIEEYTKAIGVDPCYAMGISPIKAEIYYARGSAYNDKGEFYKAIEDYTVAICINPNYGEAYYDRGMLYYFFENNYDKAHADFCSAIRIDDKFLTGEVEYINEEEEAKEKLEKIRKEMRK